MDFFDHIPAVVALVFGVMVHIAKKAAKMRLTDEMFSLKDYLIGHPYQTFVAFGMTVGAYLQLVYGAEGPISLFGAFTAGVAANSLADLAPGDRS